jgi:hypothetical protein
MINALKHRSNTRLILPVLCMTLFVLALIGSGARAQTNGVLNHPGFVDFSTLTAIADVEPTVEISLKAPLLNMVTNLIRSEDQEAAEFISRLLRVTVNVFESDAIDVAQISSSMNQITQELDSEGWDRVVRVREEGEHVDIYFRMDEASEMIHGIAIMVASPGETVLVNIVGDISSDDIAALGRRFDIDELSGLEVEVN